MASLSISDCANLSAEERAQAFAFFAEDPGFVDSLINLITVDPAGHEVASWFLKRYLEQGASVPPHGVRRIYAAMPQITRWEALLHLLQCLPYLGITDETRTAAEAVVRRGLEHENKFVRAWAFNGIAQLAAQFAQYRVEADKLLDSALQHEAPSVRARIRNIERQWSA